jgi:tetratricopeptide (TPR) repeat protein/anti-sigma regulatory factor (Ser/Thr protein kinase)
MKYFIIYLVLLVQVEICFGQAVNIQKIDSLANYLDIYKTNPKKGLRISDSIFTIAIRLKNDTILSKATYTRGVAFFYMNNYDSALLYWEKAMGLYTQADNQKKMGDCLQNIGQIFELKGNIIKANENYQHSLQIFEKLNLQDRAANMLNIIGTLNTNLENYDIAEKYYKRALDIYTRIRKQDPNNKYIQLGFAVTHNNLGTVSIRRKQLSNAMFYFEKAKKLFSQPPDSFYLAFVLHNLGAIHSDLGNYQQAEKYLNESVRYNKSIENVQLNTMTLSAKGDLMLKEKNPLRALKYYQESLLIAEEKNLTKIQLKNLKGMSDVFKMLDDYKNSLLYFEKFAILKDSLLTESKYKQIMDLQTMYETEKKEKLIVQKDRQLRKQIFTFSAIALIAIFFLVILFFLYRTREIRKRYKLENDLNLSTQKALISQMNPHFIFNALNSIQLFILKNDKISSNLFLTNFADLMRKVLDNSQFQFISLYEELEALKTYMELEKARFAKKFDYEILTPDNIPLNDYNIPTMILQPFVENAIWHGFSTFEGEGKIRIEILQPSSSTLLISIEDNGIGREKAKEITSKNGKTRKSYGTRLVEDRFKLYNQLTKSDIRFEYQDLFDEKGISKGTKVFIYLSTNFERK